MCCLHNNTTTTGGGYQKPMYISICFFSDHCEMLIGRLTLGNGGVLDSNSGGRHFDNGWFKREAWIEVDMIDCDDDEELI